MAGIDPAVPAGSFFGFLGSNGAGKTTTVRMLTGLLAPTADEAVVAGHSVQGDAVAVKRLIGVVPDTLALFDRLTFWERLTMAGQIQGLSLAATESRGEVDPSWLGGA